MNLIPGQMVTCPSCHVSQGEIVDDYVVPGEIGFQSRTYDTCWQCHREFSVTRVSESQFKVE